MPKRVPSLYTSYTQTADPNVIYRDQDSTFIPNDPANLDYQEFLAWLDAGNTPTPYTPPERTDQ